MNKKALTGVEIKDASQGTVKAVFATLNVKDSDGDVTLPGAFKDGAPVTISAYGHKTWEGALPVGKGVIRATDTEAILDGQFFLNTTAGRDTFETVKQLGDLQQWSYGFDTVEAERGKHDGEDVQFLKALDVHEVSPVLLGAGVATRTVAAKDRKAAGYQPAAYMQDGTDTAQCPHCGSGNDPDAQFCDQCGGPMPGGQPYTRMADETVRCPDCGKMNETDARFCDQCGAQLQGRMDVSKARSLEKEAEHALASVQAFTSRVKSLADIRAKEGRMISGTNRDRLSSLRSQMADAMAEVDKLLAESDPEAGKHRELLIAEAARYQRQIAAI